jgi:hypothetical protein
MSKQMLLIFCVSISGLLVAADQPSSSSQNVQTSQSAVDVASQTRLKRATEKADAVISKIKEAMSALQKDASNQVALATVQAAVSGTASAGVKSAPQTTQQSAETVTK